MENYLDYRDMHAAKLTVSHAARSGHHLHAATAIIAEHASRIPANGTVVTTLLFDDPDSDEPTGTLTVPALYLDERSAWVIGTGTAGTVRPDAVDYEDADAVIWHPATRVNGEPLTEAAVAAGLLSRHAARNTTDTAAKEGK